MFDALASEPRRLILAYLSDDELTAGEIAARFAISKPAISKHLQLLEAAGLVTSEKRGQFVWYSLDRASLTTAITEFMQTVTPVAVASEPPRGGTSPPPDRRSVGRLDRPGDPA